MCLRKSTYGAKMILYHLSPARGQFRDDVALSLEVQWPVPLIEHFIYLIKDWVILYLFYPFNHTFRLLNL